jgi:heat-inducible transcriptional repressor
MLAWLLIVLSPWHKATAARGLAACDGGCNDLHHPKLKTLTKVGRIPNFATGTIAMTTNLEDRLTGLAALDQRSRDIFRQLVDSYLETGEPVGSRTLSRSLPVALSPASVRNVMADLEEAGLLTSPHTSAGRVPTETGLRFFVDSLLDLGPIPDAEREKIDARMAGVNRQQGMAEFLADATNLLSGISRCAGVVVTPKFNTRLKHIEFLSLSPTKGLVVLVGEDGNVENRAIDLPAGILPASLTRLSNYLSARYQGRTMTEIAHSMGQEVNRIKGELDELSARVVEAGVAVWSGTDDDSKTLIVRGQARLIEDARALEDLERLRMLFDDLESKKELMRLIRLSESGEGVRIFIGSESKLFSLSGSSLIVAPYRNTENHIVGVLGVIGPTRLNYGRIIPMVDYTAQAIGRLIS